MSVIVGVITDILRSLLRTPAVRSLLLRRTAEYVIDEVSPAVESVLASIRDAHDAKLASVRRAKVDEAIGRVAQMTEPELRRLVDALGIEPDPELRKIISDAIHLRLDVFSAVRTEGPDE